MDYKMLARQLSALLSKDDWPITNMAQTSAFIFEHLADLNWAGFYLADGNGDLHLGPYQGKVACTFIGRDKGVCGAAASRRMLLRVDNVHEFAGHIACDSRSQSEVVVPLIKHDRLCGVLDIDSPKLARFTAQDAEGIKMLADAFIDATPQLAPLVR